MPTFTKHHTSSLKYASHQVAKIPDMSFTSLSLGVRTLSVIMSLTACLALVIGLGNSFSAGAQQLAKTRIQQLPSQAYYCFFQQGDTLFVGGTDRIYRSGNPQTGTWVASDVIPNASSVDDLMIERDGWFAASM